MRCFDSWTTITLIYEKWCSIANIKTNIIADHIADFEGERKILKLSIAIFRARSVLLIQAYLSSENLAKGYSYTKFLKKFSLSFEICNVVFYIVCFNVRNGT